MAIPLAYNLRNLVVRKTTTIMTALGIALTVAVLLAILALVNGLRIDAGVFRRSAAHAGGAQGLGFRTGQQFHPRPVSGLEIQAGIAAGADGQPLASLEVVTVSTWPASETRKAAISPCAACCRSGIEMRPDVHIVSGRWFDAGKPEVVVGKSDRRSDIPSARSARRCAFGRGDWDDRGRDGRRPAARRIARSGAT